MNVQIAIKNFRLYSDRPAHLGTEVMMALRDYSLGILLGMLACLGFSSSGSACDSVDLVTDATHAIDTCNHHSNTRIASTPSPNNENYKSNEYKIVALDLVWVLLRDDCGDIVLNRMLRENEEIYAQSNGKLHLFLVLSDRLQVFIRDQLSYPENSTGALALTLEP